MSVLPSDRVAIGLSSADGGDGLLSSHEMPSVLKTLLPTGCVENPRLGDFPHTGHRAPGRNWCPRGPGARTQHTSSAGRHPAPRPLHHLGLAGLDPHRSRFRAPRNGLGGGHPVGAAATAILIVVLEARQRPTAHLPAFDFRTASHDQATTTSMAAT